MSLYVRGESGPACARSLLAAIEMCEKEWGGDRAYRDVLYKLDQVEAELEALCASPGHRAAMRALPPNAAGQEPQERAEAPSYVS